MPEDSIFDDLFDDEGTDLFDLGGGENLFDDGEPAEEEIDRRAVVRRAVAAWKAMAR